MLPLVPPDMGGGASLLAGYGVSLTDLSGFQQAMDKATGRLDVRAIPAPAEAVKALFEPLQHLDAQAASLSSHAQAAVQAGQSLTPGEMVMLSVRCHEFLFQSQLTANVANRTSDGLQQLFRQQA